MITNTMPVAIKSGSARQGATQLRIIIHIVLNSTAEHLPNSCVRAMALPERTAFPKGNGQH
jgi:hypothetical protein